MKLRIGVAALQGAFTEHQDALSGALRAERLEGDVVQVRTRDELARVDALVIPGGESTTIAKLLTKFGMWDLVRQRAQNEDFPVLGTCAGLILLASEGDDQVARTDTRLLGLMDLSVNRNAFGRQRESFERDVTLDFLDEPFHAVFIRAPAGRRIWGTCQEQGRLNDSIVAARQGNRLALAFHPELTPDLRVHRHFVRLVAEWRRGREATEPLREARPSRGP